MRIILCDDDISFVHAFEKQLRSVLEARGSAPEIILTHTGMDALREITQSPADVLFLDIEMPEQDGFSVAGELTAMEHRPLIVFLSGMDHLVYQSFAFQPFWFLRKSHPEELTSLADRLVQVWRERQIYYTVSVNGKNIRLPVSDIVYLESGGHYITAFRQGEPVRFKARMSDVEKELSRHGFVRCHVGYLVNCRFIEVCSRTELTLLTGQTIPVSRTKADETQLTFMTYMRSVRP